MITGTGEILFESTADTRISTASLPLLNGVRVMDFDGQPFLVGTEMARQSGDASAGGWALHAMVSTDIAYAGITVLRNRIALLSVAVLAIALLLGAFGSSRWIVAPIKRVTKLMREVSRGNVDLNLTGKSRRDEVGEMLRSISVFRENLLEQNRVLLEREQALHIQNIRFDAALTNMSQGLAMFDADGKLVVCNGRFSKLYRLPSRLSGAGAKVEEISDHVASTRGFDNSSVFRAHDTLADSASGTVFLSLADGRTIAIQHQLMPGGGWVSTHEDITGTTQNGSQDRAHGAA